MHLRRLLAVFACAVLALAAAPLAYAQTPKPPVPNPRVIGPIPAKPVGDPSRDYPWMSTMHPIEQAGYVEEEFFIEGTARRFNTTGDNAMNGTLRSEGHPYKTRILVRRPKNMRKFNGVVLAEWQNVTAGYDLDAMWGGSFEHIVREGYAWVGISPQRVGVQGEPNGLKHWSPTRYGTLDVTAGGTITDDSLAYDIFAQGLQAIRSPQGVNMLGGAVPKTMIIMGASQSAGRLGTYINALHSILGGPVDAYYLMIGGARVREDLDVPVFKLLTETDVPGQVRARQPDTDKFRHWEVAGASHSSRRTSMNAGPMVRRDGVERAAPDCQYPPYPRVPTNYVLGATYDHITRWVQDGVPPPLAPRMDVDGNTIRRDEHGLGLGGIRLAEFDPPTAINTGVNSGGRFCNLYGRYEPFPDEKLDQLYPSHAAYLARANAITAANLRAGYIVAEDARESRARAAQSIYGRPGACADACHAAQDLLDAAYFYLALSPSSDRLTSRLAGVIRAIHEGNDARARNDLTRWVAELRRLEQRGQLSPTTVAELANGADGVLDKLD